MAKLTLAEQSAPSTPTSNSWVIYPKSDGLYFKDDLGTEYRLIADNHLKYKINVTVASNNITVALKHPDGTDPSPTRPIWFYINGSWRACIAALSVTKNAATNWAAAGSVETATKEIDWFAYIFWNTNPATDIIDLGFARFPYGRVFSDFSTTTTNEKYLAHANGTDPVSTDDCIVIGRFAATLSATAAFNWSVPTFTNVNLINEPVYETRWLDWVPAWTGLTSMTVTSVTVTVAKYQFSGRRLFVQTTVTAFTIGGTPSPVILQTLPFSGARAANTMVVGPMLFAENGANGFGGTRLTDASPDQLGWVKYNAANWAAGAGTALFGNGFYEPA